MVFLLHNNTFPAFFYILKYSVNIIVKSNNNNCPRRTSFLEILGHQGCHVDVAVGSLEHKHSQSINSQNAYTQSINTVNDRGNVFRKY